MAKQISKTAHITKNMTIGDVVEKYPDAAQILTEKGLHCVGCSVQFWETLEGGFRGHGWTDEQIDQTIEEINKYIDNAEKNPIKELVLSEKAAEKLKVLIKEEKDSEIKGIRVQVVPGGCAGFQYGMDFEKETYPDDKVIEQHGLKLFLDPESRKLLNGCEIEYVEGIHESGFKFKNPNSKGGCGCGKSFS